MAVREINFDGIVGPSHNYAGLSLGNLAATRNAGTVSRPREAALQGVAKMRLALAMGLSQGILLPHRRPNRPWLGQLGTSVEEAPPQLRAAAYSASPMWTANAATVSPAADTADGRCHLTVANLATMAHRSHEWPETRKQLELAFPDRSQFQIHPPVPGCFGDEGAANHMRLSRAHDQPGVEIFVFGESGGRYPARQHMEACRAIGRLHGLDPDRALFVRQSAAAIAAGAFHNDVVAVSNEHVLLVHEHAFENAAGVYEDLRRLLPEVEIVEVPASAISLDDAIASYLFNAQLVSLSEGAMALILPAEVRETPAVWSWLQQMTEGSCSIRQLECVDVRHSMRNGGGPACLRLRVVADPKSIDPRFLADGAKLDRIASVIEREWPEAIAPADLRDAGLGRQIEHAREELCKSLNLLELV